MKRTGNKDIERKIHGYLAQKPEIYSAYIFGSRAGKRIRKTSDIDVAILVDDRILSDTLPYRSRISADLQELTGCRADVVILNRANLLVRAQVFQKGKLLFEHDPDLRALFQARSMGRYYDYKRYLEFHARRLSRKIREAGLG